MQVTKFICETFFASNLYIVEGKNNFLVDPSFFDDSIERFINKIGGIDFILLTHGHIDHFYGLNKLLKRFDVPVYCLHLETKVLRNYRYNLSYELYDEIIEFDKSKPLFEGLNKIKDTEFKVFSMPGHTIGSAIYLFEEDKVLFTGDFIFSDNIGRYDLPTASEVSMYESIEKFKKLHISEDTKVYPGHNKITNIKDLFNNNFYLK